MILEESINVLKSGLNKPATPGSMSGLGMVVEDLKVINDEFNTKGNLLSLELTMSVYRINSDGSTSRSKSLVTEFDVPAPNSGVIGNKQVINIAYEATRVYIRSYQFKLGKDRGESSISFDIEPPSKEDPQQVKFYISRRGTPAPDYQCSVSTFLNYLGIDETKYENINKFRLPKDINEKFNPPFDFKNFLLDPLTMTTISMYTQKDYKDGRITKELIEDILNIYNDLEKFKECRDQKTPLDFTYLDYDKSLAKTLSESISGLRWSIGNYFSNKYEKFIKNNPDATPDQALASFEYIPVNFIRTVFWNFQNNMSGDVNITQQALDSSPLAAICQSSKIIFKFSNYDNTSKKVPIIPSKFIGVVDPVFTADSNEINIKNLMSMSASLDGSGSVNIEVLDKKFRLVRLSLNQYLKSSVLSSDNVDYFNKSIHPDDNGEYSIYKYGHYMKTKNVSDIDYYRTENGIVSTPVGLMPFANRSASMRVLLASHFITTNGDSKLAIA